MNDDDSPPWWGILIILLVIVGGVAAYGEIMYDNPRCGFAQCRINTPGGSND